jgi:hypothetical protein
MAVTQQNMAAVVAPNCRLTSFCNIQSPKITPSPRTPLTKQKTVMCSVHRNNESKQLGQCHLPC